MMEKLTIERSSFTSVLESDECHLKICQVILGRRRFNDDHLRDDDEEDIYVFQNVSVK
jgi:hypothetical protein